MNNALLLIGGVLAGKIFKRSGSKSAQYLHQISFSFTADSSDVADVILNRKNQRGVIEEVIDNPTFRNGKPSNINGRIIEKIIIKKEPNRNWEINPKFTITLFVISDKAKDNLGYPDYYPDLELLQKWWDDVLFSLPWEYQNTDAFNDLTGKKQDMMRNALLSGPVSEVSRYNQRARSPYISRSKEEKRRKRFCGSYCLELYSSNANFTMRTLEYFGEMIEYEGCDTGKVFVSSTGIPYIAYKAAMNSQSQLRKF